MRIDLPLFARLHDYTGLWLMRHEEFADLHRLAERTDWSAHMAAAPAKVSSYANMVPAKGGKSTAIIEARGTLAKSQLSFGGSSSVQLRRDIRAAANDPNVTGIALVIDSPGGTVAGTPDLAAEVKAARRKKPVYAFIEDLGASAAYWLASQADMIFAGNQTTQIGSIGTVMAVFDESAAAEKEGVKVHVITTGPLKANVSGAPVSDEYIANAQARVNEIQAQFDAAVRSGRGMTAAQLAAVRSGAVFLANEAMGLKLIDGIKSFDQTLEALAAAR